MNATHENEIDLENIAAIKAILLAAGPLFSGGSDESAEVAAREWDGHDFTDDGVRIWTNVGVWDAAVANALHSAQVPPRRLRDINAALLNESDIEDAVYAACNGDLKVERLIEAYEAL